jgi:hypothetical protein
MPATKTRKTSTAAAPKATVKSLREALLAACTAKPQPVKDVIAKALELHPLAGKTPAASR